MSSNTEKAAADPGANSPAARGVRLWDLPTRLFHWTLVLLVALSYATGEYGLLDMDWHFRVGYAVLALLLFRVLWGLFGSHTSRFAAFVRGPAAIVAYARALVSKNPQISIGHNPLGGWSVLALLASVGVQSVTGLFASDEIDVDGPLVPRVATRTVRLMTRLHHWNWNLLLVLIGLHVTAVLLYLLVKKDNLIAPMLSGRRVFGAGAGQAAGLRFASGWRALALFGFSAGLVAALVWLFAA